MQFDNVHAHRAMSHSLFGRAVCCGILRQKRRAAPCAIGSGVKATSVGPKRVRILYFHCAGCPSNATGIACPADFTYISSVNGCYKLLTSNRNWNDAGLGCRSLHEHAHLLVVNNVAEQTAIAGMLDSISR